MPGVWTIGRVNYAPKAAKGLSPGFQPWEPTSERRALKGGQIECTSNAEMSPNCRMSRSGTLRVQNNNPYNVEIKISIDGGDPDGGIVLGAKAIDDEMYGPENHPKVSLISVVKTERKPTR